MNRIHPKKLRLGKWTAVTPVNKEKHFLVVDVTFDDAGETVTDCVIEAVYTKRQQHIDWQELKDDSRWKTGWH